LTIVDDHGLLAPPYHAESPRTAVRPGVVYTLGDATRIELEPGRYRVYATRGMEWGMDSAAVEVFPGQSKSVALSLAREVDTRGFIAADTHLHTLTFSGHGDSSVAERLVTLAGEGVEFAVATDHNHNTDYRPLQREMALSEYFYSVTGNEVTTQVGHF